MRQQGEAMKPAKRFFSAIRTKEQDTEGLINRGSSREIGLSLTEKGADEIFGLIDRAIVANATKAAISEGLDERFRNDARSLLNKYLDLGESAELSEDELITNEAIIQASGQRPSIEIINGKILLDGISIDRDLRGFVESRVAEIETAAHSIGRVDLDGRHIGSCVVIPGGQILTARHVLQAISEEDNAMWASRGGVTVSFAKDEPPIRLSDQLDVALAGASEILPERLDSTKLDFAIIRIADDALPPPLKLAPLSEFDDALLIPGRSVFVCGFPGKPPIGKYEFDVLNTLFGLKFGVKRFSPGELCEPPNFEPPVFIAHDCTTLGGSSGSAIIDLAQRSTQFIGIHISGSMSRNVGHPVNRFLSAAELSSLIDKLN